MPDVTPGDGFSCPHLTACCHLDELGLEVTEQRLASDRAVLACRIVKDDSRSKLLPSQSKSIFQYALTYPDCHA